MSSSEARTSEPIIDQSLVTDFKHLGIAVEKDDNGEDRASKETDTTTRPLQASHSADKTVRNQNNEEIQSRQGSSTSTDVGDDPSTERVMATGQRSDTSVSTTVAAPVTHETRHIQHQEVRTEVVQKDIHVHHQVTRILPIIDQEVLPARHFIKTADGQKFEIPPPAQTSSSTNADVPETSAVNTADMPEKPAADTVTKGAR